MTDLSHSTFARPAIRRGLFSHISHLISVARQRHALRDLSDAQLSDIGITRAQALAESKRSAWDAPRGWRR